MPITKENRSRYPDDWPQIRESILTRARNRCEWCGVPNYAVGHRASDGEFVAIRGNIYADLAGQGLSYPSVEPLTYSEARQWADDCNELGNEDGKLIVIVLTIAHIHDDSPENCDPANLAALCQQCHNRHDAPSRAKRRKAKRDAGQRTLPLETNQ